MIGQEILHYKIIEKLGEGGMGVVYKAEDTKLKRSVALKFLPANVLQGPEEKARFNREAQAAAALNHANIATIHAIEEYDDKLFIIMEYIEGKELRAIIGETGPLTTAMALGYATQIAAGLQAAHKKGIIHRDIKSSNIMITEEGQAKIMDFGLAKIAGDAQLTKEHSTIGTTAYMSPEQTRGKETDHRTDIWSFGVVLYEMLSGALPFRGDYEQAVLYSILNEQPEWPEKISAQLQSILKKALAKELNDRYQNLKELFEDLRSLSGGAKPASKAVLMTSRSKQTGNRIFIYGGIALVLLITSLVWYFNRSQPITSIAVMPFLNASGDSEVEYLSDGMTETLISSLSQLPRLNVKPRSSVFRYKGSEKNPQVIGEELAVQAILNGRIVQRGQDLSLFVELIDLAMDKVVWSAQYNRRQTDLVALQAEIALDVSGKLKTRLSGEEEAKITRAYTTNPEAYQLYLKGNFYRTKYTEEGFHKGIEYYQKAIAIDPDYALAYHGIAAAYDFSNGWFLPPAESSPKAKTAALKALELDETLAETHYLLGKIIFWYDWDWAAAEKEWKRANELDPAYPALYPVYLMVTNRFQEALNTQQALVQRFPLDLNVILDYASMLWSAGRYDLCIEEIRKALELDPDFWWSYQVLGLVYERKKQFPEAITALEKAARSSANPSCLGYLGYVYGAAGRKTEAQKVLAELGELSKQRYVSPYYFTLVYTGLNDKDQAFDWLERAYQARSYYMAVLKSEVILDNLRPDPRFRDLLKRMNLPE